VTASKEGLWTTQHDRFIWCVRHWAKKLVTCCQGDDVVRTEGLFKYKTAWKGSHEVSIRTIH